MEMFENLNKKVGWAERETFYPTPWTKTNASGYVNATGDAFSATNELKKLQDQCYASYPDGLIKGYHKGRTKAYNKCMDNASTTINNLIKENTKLKSDETFSATVQSSLGSATSSSGGVDSNTIIGAVVILLIAGAAYYWWSRRATATAAPVAAAPVVVKAV